MSGSNFPIKRAWDSFNKSLKDNSPNNFLINKTNSNSISLNISIKFIKPKNKLSQKGNKLFPNAKKGIGFNINFNSINKQLLNKSCNLSNLNKINRALIRASKFSLSRSSNFFNPKSLKFNRRITPNPKSKLKLALVKVIQ